MVCANQHWRDPRWSLQDELLDHVQSRQAGTDGPRDERSKVNENVEIAMLKKCFISIIKSSFDFHQVHYLYGFLAGL